MVGDVIEGNRVMSYIGNSSQNELFAEYLDDVRIYSVSLITPDISNIAVLVTCF